MKTPRLFILSGALALLFTFAFQTFESAARPSWAESLPIMRADPWAGDPEEPGFSRQIPFEESGDYSVTYEEQESAGAATTPSAHWLRQSHWMRILHETLGRFFWRGRG